MPSAPGPPDPRAVLTRPAPPPERTVRYGPDPCQVYDVRLPSSAARAGRGATVVVVHGGFWRESFDRAHAGSQAQALADDGFHAAVPEYRRTGMPGGGWPGTAQDVAAAVAAVRADPQLPGPVVLVGHSAGGHLAAWVASQPDRPDQPDQPGSGLSRLAGVVSLAGCVDLTLTARLHLDGGAAQDLMGAGPDELPDAYALADPALLTPTCPVVLLHGADDQVVPPEVSRSYLRAALARGAQARLTVIPGAEHFALIDPEHPAFAAVLDAVRALGLVRA